MTERTIPMLRLAHINQLVAGFVSEHGARYALLSNNKSLPPNEQKYQLGVAEPGKQPLFYETTWLTTSQGSSGGSTYRTGLGILTIGIAKPSIDGPSGIIHLSVAASPDLFRDMGVRRAEPTSRP